MIFSGATDKQGAVWDAEVGVRVKKLKGHSSFVNSVSSSQRGSQVVATGSDDGTAKVRWKGIAPVNNYLLIRYGILGAVLLIKL